MKGYLIDLPEFSTNIHSLLASSQLGNYFTWPMTLCLYLHTPQREKFTGGGEEGGEKKKEMDGENELEPVRPDPELGIPRVYLPLAFLAEGSFIKGKKHSEEIMASCPQLKWVSPYYANLRLPSNS